MMPTGMVALLYQSSGTHYAYRGGSSGPGAYCGVFNVNANDAASTTRWTRGAALSFRLNIKYRVIVIAITLYFFIR